ncbi:MAG: lysostaphin resistance A-like protein [Bacteroidales bacterium]
MNRFPLLSEMSPFSKLLFLIIIIFTTFLATVFIGFLAGIPFFGSSFFTRLDGADFNDPANLPLLKYFQIISQFGFFIFPPLIFAFLIHGKVAPYLLLNKKIDLWNVILVGSLLFCSMPFTGWLIDLNERMQLPGFLQNVEEWMKQSEAEAEIVTRSFLTTQSYSGFSVNLLMMVILPSLGEELIFRGVLIRLFREMTKNIHWAVIISSVLFSAMHLQFYGFIPRMVLGLLLGYVFVWSANLWMPIIMHLINNGFAVIAAFLSARGVIETNYEQIGNQPAYWEIGLSILFSLALLYVIFMRQKRLRFL